MIEYFLILRKMNPPDGLPISGKPVPLRDPLRQASFPQVSHLFRQFLRCQIHSVQRLTHRLCHGIIRKTDRQAIERLQRIQFLLILRNGIEDLRMLHHKPFFSSDHPSPQRDRAALRKRTAKKRHTKPDHFQSPCQILHIQCCHLHLCTS